MRKRILEIVGGLGLCVGIILAGTVLAGTYQYVGGLVTINNSTNNTAPTSFGSFQCFPVGSTFSITNAGLTATNALTILGQFSLDGSNWTTVATWTPSVTNATNVAWAPSISPQAAYWRLSVITTNEVELGVAGHY